MNWWYTRPVLFVEDLARSLNYYMGMLGFEKAWHEGDGKGKVCQVWRAECEIILCEDPKRRDRGRLFISVDRDGIDQLEREIVQRSIPNKKSWWGYDVIELEDPDGNQLLFPLPSSSRGTDISVSV
jgi:hypothetical protein